jgi:hypothetical protein
MDFIQTYFDTKDGVAALLCHRHHLRAHRGAVVIRQRAGM